MKIDFYRLMGGRGQLMPDIEHELPVIDAITQARAGQVVLVKLWLRTDGPTDLEDLETKLQAVLAPLQLR